MKSRKFSQSTKRNNFFFFLVFVRTFFVLLSDGIRIRCRFEAHCYKQQYSIYVNGLPHLDDVKHPHNDFRIEEVQLEIWDFEDPHFL